MGFAKGFAQGWSEESDRIERRKMFQAELNEKRIATLAEVIARRKAMGLGGSSTSTEGGTDSGGSADAVHYSNVLVGYGVQPDTVAEISKKGPYALKAAAEVIEKNPDAIWTPETFSKLPQAIVVTQNQTGSLDANAIISELYGPEFLAQMDPVQKELLNLEGMSAPTAPLVSTTIRPSEPVKQEVLNATVEAANATLIAELTARKEQYDELIQNGQTPEEKAAAAKRSQYFEGLITEVGENNVVPAIREVGADIIGPYLENNPQLKANPQLLGAWAPAAQAYLNPEKPEVTPTRTYNSFEEVQAEVDSGTLQEGQEYIVNGKTYKVRLAD